MRLVRMVLQGFKSFASKTVFEIRGDVCAIVGPNGCGKSNIVDAFLWALGEQRPKTLRASSMEEVIFAGTQNVPPADFAQVTLVFDAPELKDILKTRHLTITRRLSRDGTSSYIVNDNRMRLKELRQLLAGTGLGTGAYAVIQQQRLDEVLELNGQKRRELLEEAAGVSGWRASRQEALRNLKQAEAALDAVARDVAELRRQRRKLKRQAARARRAKTLAQQKKILRAKILSLRHISASQKLNLLLPKLHKIQQQLQSLQNQLNTVSTEEASTKARLAEISVRLKEITAKIEEARQRRENIRVEMERQKERLRSIEAEITLLSHKGEEVDDVARISAVLKQMHQTKADLEATLQNRQKQLENLRRLTETKRREKTALQKQCDETRQQIGELVHAAAISENRAAMLEKHATTLQRNLAALDDDIAALNQRLTLNRKLLEEARQKQRALIEKRNHLHKSLQQKQKQIRQIQQEIKSLEQELAALRKEEAAVLGRLEALQEVLSRDKGAAEAERIASAIRNAGWNACLLKEFLTDGADAAPCERTILVPPDTPLAKILNQTAPSCYLRFLLCDEMTKEGAEKALAQVWKRRDSVAEVVLHGGHNSKLRRHGPIVEFMGEMASYGERLCQKRKLKQRAEMISGKKATLKGRLQAKQQQLRKETADIEDVRRQLEETERQLQAAQRKINDALARDSHLEQELESLMAQRERLKQEIAAAAEDARNERKNAEKARQTEQQLRQKLHCLTEALGSADEELAEAMERWRVAESELARLQERLSSLIKRMTELKEQMKRKEQERATRQKRLHAAHLAKKSTTDRLAQLEASLISTEKLLTELNSTREEHEHNSSILTAHLSRISEELNRLNRAKEELQKEEMDIATRITECRTQIKEIENTAKEEELPLFEEVEESDAELTEKLEKVLSEIEKLGPVNEEAEAELEQVEGKLLYLEGQKADIEEGVQKLRETIERLDSQFRERMEKVYGVLRENFGAVFRRLFGGGRADVRLVGDDIYEASVEIVASPPGKESSTMRLLSGGERALCAIAFLFALHRARPAPVCFLDEIDAPLDDANTKRLMALLRSFSSSTQFVVVTHNKITMAAADSLIGVTMRKPNLSQLLSIQLRDTKTSADTAA